MSKIIKCLIVDDEPVAREILEQHISQVAWLELVAGCKNAMDAFKLINSKNIDLIFLDINMPEISGLSFARSINKNIKVIFSTAYREYAVDGFDLQAVDYLLKPISFDRFLQAVNKYRNEILREPVHEAQLPNADRDNFIYVRSDRKMVRINFDDVLYVESLSDYVKIHLQDSVIVTRETITNFEEMLPQNAFIRIHRSYLVAVNKIHSFTNEVLEIGKHQLPISRSYKDEVLKQLKKD